jgi:hypothetical protein
LSPNKEKPRTHWIYSQILPYSLRIIATLFKLFQLIEIEGTLPNHSIQPALPSFQNWTRTQQKNLFNEQKLSIKY